MVVYRLDCDIYNQPYTADYLLNVYTMLNNEPQLINDMVAAWMDPDADELKAVQENKYSSKFLFFQEMSTKVIFLDSVLKHLWYNKTISEEDKNLLTNTALTNLDKLKNHEKFRDRVNVQTEIDIYKSYVTHNPFAAPRNTEESKQLDEVQLESSLSPLEKIVIDRIHPRK
jgi:hypothetical protein